MGITLLPQQVWTLTFCLERKIIHVKWQLHHNWLNNSNMLPNLVINFVLVYGSTTQHLVTSNIPVWTLQLSSSTKVCLLMLFRLLFTQLQMTFTVEGTMAVQPAGPLNKKKLTATVSFPQPVHGVNSRNPCLNHLLRIYPGPWVDWLT